MIEVKGLTKTFHDKKHGDVKAVNHVSFSVNAGEIYGLLGPNGAGKTTLLRMLATIMSPTEGHAIINGCDTSTDPDGVKHAIGFLSGNTKLYKKLTPIETLRFFGKFYNIEKSVLESRIQHIIKSLDMEDFKNRVVEKLSTGQVQRTSIARCLIHDPQVYMLDEPTLGLDILTSRTIIDFIKSEKQRGKTIVFSTHYMEEADALCDRIGLIHKGVLLASESTEEMQRLTGKTAIRDIFLHYIDSGAFEEPSKLNEVYLGGGESHGKS